MVFDARVQVLENVIHSCTRSGNLLLSTDGSTNTVTLIFAAGTNYDQKKGTAASNYSFKGVDPAATVLLTIQAASIISYSDIYSAHVKDHGDLFSQFALDLPDPNNSANIPTPQLMTQYTTDAGDPFAEALLFDYEEGRELGRPT
jgi:alpha-L-fucosidase 2